MDSGTVSLPSGCPMCRKPHINGVASEFRLPCGHMVDDAFLTDNQHEDQLYCPLCKKFCLTKTQAARLARPCAVCMGMANSSDDASYHVTPCGHVICHECLLRYISEQVSKPQTVACKECQHQADVYESLCSSCGAKNSVSGLLLCPECRARLGFAWAQKEVDIYWTLPGIYDKMDPLLKSIVAEASLPMLLLHVLAVFIVLFAIILISLVWPL